MRAPAHIDDRPERGMTVLEIMVVLAVIALLLALASRGLRRVTKADLTDDTLELATALRRTSQAAIETGQLHRVVIDFEHNTFAVEVCQGQGTIARTEKEPERSADPREVQDKLEAARHRLETATGASLEPANPEDAAKIAAAIAGHHVLDRVCTPAPQSRAPGAMKTPIQTLRTDGPGVKFHEVWVQHLEDSVTSGTVAIHFFPTGTAEKSVIELSSGSDTLTILVYGLSGRIEVKDEAIKDPEAHMLRDVNGDKEAER